MPYEDARPVVGEEALEDSNDQDTNLDSSEDEDVEVTDDSDTEEDVATQEDADDGDEESDEEESDDSEYFDSEEDFLSSYGLPGEPKTLDDAMRGYKAMAEKINEYQRAEAAQRQANELPPADTRQEGAEPFFKGGFFSDHINKMFDGVDPANENAKFFKSVGKVFDEAIQPHLKQVEQAHNILGRAAQLLINNARDNSWKSFQYKNVASRDELDRIMNQTGEIDYARAYARKMANDPTFLSEFAKRQQEKGREKERAKKKRIRFTGQRRSAPSKPSDKVYSKFLTPDGALDNDKLGRLNDPTMEKTEKIVNAYLADMEKKSKRKG